MLPVELKPDIFWIGVNDHDIRLFEGLWPISQEGISYNSYLINDEKKALIDMASDGTTDTFLHQLQRVTDVAKLDYIIINHMEPDHSGALDILKRLAPGVQILCTKRAKDMLQAFFEISENIHVIEDGETLKLGKYTLRFISTPNVHWPETMMTYVEEEKILFSCDAFGGYGVLKGSLFADQYPQQDIEFYKQEAKRYFVNIIATFSRPVLNAIQKLADLPLEILAPSHGLVWRDQSPEVIGWYKDWAEYSINGGKPGITLMYASMYGSTKRMMDAVAQGAALEDIELDIFNISEDHISHIMTSIWEKRGVLVGAPTYEGSLFPPMAHALDMLSVKHISGKMVARFGSYGWKSGGTQKVFDEIITSMKWEQAGVLEFNGRPTEEDLQKGIEFGREFARKVKEAAAI